EFPWSLTASIPAASALTPSGECVTGRTVRPDKLYAVRRRVGKILFCFLPPLQWMFPLPRAQRATECIQIAPAGGDSAGGRRPCWWAETVLVGGDRYRCR